MRQALLVLATLSTGLPASAAGNPSDRYGELLLSVQNNQVTAVFATSRGIGPYTPAEFGINIPEGLERALTMARQVLEGDAPDVPAAAVKIIFALSQQALDTHSHRGWMPGRAVPGAT